MKATKEPGSRIDMLYIWLKAFGIQTLKRQGSSVEQACRILEPSRSGHYS